MSSTRPSLHSDEVHNPRYTSPECVSTGRMEAALKRVSKKALLYEDQMRDIETRLSHHLLDFRKVDGGLQNAFRTLQVSSERVDRALDVQVPHIESTLNESMEALMKLQAELPAVQSQVNNISGVYSSGHQVAKVLVSELEWLNTDFYERWRRIIFTSKSPASWRWKAIMRTLFVISFMICFRLLWIALAGAYRAHRHRLVWGDKLMS